MSNQYLKLRRSNVQGRIPTTESIDFGEIALNTYDGKAYMKVSGSDGIKVVPIGSSTGSFSGSFTGDFSGSFSGSLFGTASWADSASIALFANDYIFTSSILEYYVDRRFSGGCGITIDSTKTITSTNPDYLIQLSSSRIGDPNHPYPDPWSATFDASASIAAGFTTNARVIIKTGNSYTYGSSTLVQNGDMTGSLTNNLTPDVAVSQSDYNNRVFDLIYPNVELYFEPESGLTNINKTWQQALVYYTSSNWDVIPEFKITGKGIIKYVYGQGQGFIGQFGIIAAPRANITLEADHIINNMYQGWILTGENIQVNVNKWWSYSSYFLTTNYYGTYGAAAPLARIPIFNYISQSLAFPSSSITPSVNININEIKFGQFNDFGIAPHFADYWAGISFGYPYGSTYNINVNNLYYISNAVDPFYLFNGTPSFSIDPLNPTTNVSYNNRVKINTNYVSASKGSNHPAGGGRATFVGGHLYDFCRGGYGGPLYTFNENLYIHAHIDKMDSWGIGAGSGHDTSNLSNSTIIFSCNDYTLYNRLGPFTGFSGNIQADSCTAIRLAFYTGSQIGAPTGSFINNNIVFKGTYRNYSNASTISNITAGGIGAKDNILYTNIIFDNFNSYQMNSLPTASALASSASVVFGNVFLADAFPTGSYVIMKDSLFYTSGSTFVRNTATKPINIITRNVSTNIDFPSDVNVTGDVTIIENLNKLRY
jgi:hypothetical protein